MVMSETNTVVVRLKTSFWNDSRGVYQKRALTFLRRKSRGFDWIYEEANMGGADQLVSRILNLNTVNDGVYRLVTCNESRDWETGIIDDYDFRLVPYDE
jgi:hypothetical protein